MTRYTKTIIALLGGISAWGVTAVSDGSNISAAELFGLLGVIATALGVYAFPNKEGLDETGSAEIVWMIVGAVAIVVLLLVLGWVDTSPK